MHQPLLVTISALLLAGAAQTPTEAFRQDLEDRARTQAADLLRTLCPEQCVLLSVEARVSEEVTGDVVPGFEPLSPTAKIPRARSLSASVLADSQLPASFRARLRAVLSERLKPFGVPVTVAIQSVAFPPPKQDPPPQQPQLQASPPPTPAGPAPTPAERLQARLIEEAPALIAIGLLGLIAAVLGVLAYLALRRREPGFAGEAGWEELSVPPAGAISPPSFPEPRLRALERRLREDRWLRSAVVREALESGEPTLLAAWARELGEFLFADVRTDPRSAAALEQVAQAVAQDPDSARAADSLGALERRTLAWALRRPPDADRDPFAFLSEVSPARFAAAALSLAPGSREVALRHAPAALREAALVQLPEDEKRALAQAWVRPPNASERYLRAIADELREAVEGTAPAGDGSEALHALLETLPRAEQDALEQRLSASGALVVTESSLLRAPSEVLAPVLVALPAASLADYLHGADRDLRDHLLAACPARVRNEVVEELGLREPGSGAEFSEGRRRLLREVRQELSRRGLAGRAASSNRLKTEVP